LNRIQNVLIPWFHWKFTNHRLPSQLSYPIYSHETWINQLCEN